MGTPIIVNGSYGTTIGNRLVFTREGAVKAYKDFARLCLANLTMEGSSVLADVADDMRRIGFMPQELEDMEIEVLIAM